MKRSEVDRNKLSPMMQQYMDIKDKYDDCIVFFRLGDFYEMFFEDAITASRVLELTLTGKQAGLDERVPMCGIPHHAYSSYIDELIEQDEENEKKRIEEMDKYMEIERKQMEYDIVPRRGITVKILPDAHKKLKLIAAAKETTLEMLVTSIVENEINPIDIAQYVADVFDCEAILRFHEENHRDMAKSFYDDFVSQKLIKGKHMKRINVKVDTLTHQKLRIIAATEDRSLDNIVSEILESEVGISLNINELYEEAQRNKDIQEATKSR